MKKITLCIMATFLSLTFLPVQSNAATSVAPSSSIVLKTSEVTEAKALYKRLDEIKALDKSNMKSSEKKVLRKEVRTIKHQLSDLGGGVYISAGALIIILLLLIILL
jgi:hypothetical protein